MSPRSAGRLGGVAFAVALLAAVPAAAGTPATVLDLPVRRGDGPAVPLGRLLDGAPAVVALWATYCPPCRAEVPVLRDAARRWKPRGVRVVGVAVDFAGDERVGRAVHDWGIDYDTYRVDRSDEDAVAALVPTGLPVSFVVGPTGVTRHDGFVSGPDLDALIARMLGDASTTPSR